MNIEEQHPPEFHLSVLNHQIRDMMNHVLRKYDLKLVEWRVLQSLAEEDTLTVCDLSTRTVIERTATGRLVDRLVDRALVTKKQMPNDRRFSKISLLPKGEEKLEACAKDVAQARSVLFSGLDQSDIEKLLDLLAILQENAHSVVQPKAKVRARRV